VNFLECLILRRAVGTKKLSCKLDRASEKRLYRSLIDAAGWKEISADFHVLDHNTFSDRLVPKVRDMLTMLCEFKLNDEKSDETTRMVMSGMAAVPQNRRARRTLASICASINGKGFLRKFRNVNGLSRLLCGPHSWRLGG